MSAQTIQTPDQQALARTLAAIDRLGLNDNLIELDTRGYTIVRGVLSADQVERAREAILKRVESRVGKRVDPDELRAQRLQHPRGRCDRDRPGQSQARPAAGVPGDGVER